MGVTLPVQLVDVVQLVIDQVHHIGYGDFDCSMRSHDEWMNVEVVCSSEGDVGRGVCCSDENSELDQISTPVVIKAP